MGLHFVIDKDWFCSSSSCFLLYLGGFNVWLIGYFNIIISLICFYPFLSLSPFQHFTFLFPFLFLVPFSLISLSFLSFFHP